MTPVSQPQHMRVDPETIEALGRLGVATVHEVLSSHGLLDPSFRPIIDDLPIAGRAVTALCSPGDNLMIHAAVEACSPGDVLVVACEDSTVSGVLGELLATSLQARGVVGCVLKPGVRDVAALRKMRFPVWTPHIYAKGTTKTGLRAVNVPVACGGVVVHPGDVVVADDDGVLVVPAAEAADAVARGEQRVRKEDAVRPRLAAGELGLDIYGLRGLLTGSQGSSLSRSETA